MINFSNLNIKRAIMHQILGKTNYNENAHCEFSDELLDINAETECILKQRLMSALGRNSKSFELTMSDDSEGSVFSYMKNMRELDEGAFIESSKTISEHLAASSNKGGIPGGFLLFLDCEYDNKPIYILIKAEPHDAISVIHHQAQALRDIILSPTQKLYKAFCMVQKNQQYGKDDFTYLLFDNQFASGCTLARYFYKDFLGLTLKDNSVLLTKLFYDRMLAMVNPNFPMNILPKQI